MLIDKSELLKAYDAAHKGPPGGARKLIEEAPAVDAVPLDKLCLLLHDIAGCPCYTQRGEDMCNRLIGDQCNAEWNDVECWKLFLTKWMEGLDATD